MSSHNPYILLVDCPDALGIVHKVTGVLFRQGLNIDDQGEFVEPESQHFFMRTEVSGEINPALVLHELSQVVPQGARVRISEKKKKKIVVLVTREAHCLGDLLIRHDYGELSAEICAVLSNRSQLGALVEKFGIPFHFISHEGQMREEHEEQMRAAICCYRPDYLVLAKYMRVLSASFVSVFRERIINIHHSFLPAFIGAKPYHRAHERGVKIIGATAHFVTEELDEGPIIAQDITRVNHKSRIEDMIRAGRNVEKIVLADALRLVLEDRVFLHNNRSIIFE